MKLPMYWSVSAFVAHFRSLETARNRNADEEQLFIEMSAIVDSLNSPERAALDSDDQSSTVRRDAHIGVLRNVVVDLSPIFKRDQRSICPFLTGGHQCDANRSWCRATSGFGQSRQCGSKRGLRDHGLFHAVTPSSVSGDRARALPVCAGLTAA
jgi:hypothetical protein